MEFKSLKKIHDGHFIHRYDITYETVDGKEKVYASIYDATGKDMNLYPIETEKEWNLIFNILESIQKKMEEEKNV